MMLRGLHMILYGFLMILYCFYMIFWEVGPQFSNDPFFVTIDVWPAFDLCFSGAKPVPVFFLNAPIFLQLI